MSDLLSFLGLVAAAGTIAVVAFRRWWPTCGHAKPFTRSAAMVCRRPRWHLGHHRTARFGRGPTVAFWRRDLARRLATWRAR